MTSRERFRNTMRFKTADRVPYLEEGIRKDVLKSWSRQGLPKKTFLNEIIPIDKSNEIIFDIDPLPGLKKWPKNIHELDALIERLNPHDPSRYPKKWKKIIKNSKTEDTILFIRVHRGFFLTMGVYNWQRFNELMELLVENPDFVKKYMMIYGDFTAKLFEKVLTDINVDAVIFSEPIGANTGALISPEMYEEFALKSYVPLLSLLKSKCVETIIVRTYANCRLLIPRMMAYGFNCLWAVETYGENMDYRKLRKEFGRDLRLIGGIDEDVLHLDRKSIRHEVESKVPPLLADGGYIPLADGRIRRDVPFENYLFYRRLLMQLTAKT